MDQVYTLSVPSISRVDGTVFYHFQLHDALKDRTYVADFRFKVLHSLHKALQPLEKTVRLPDFPKKHTFPFFKKTNERPQLIEKRRKELENYFMALLNNPFVRGTPQVKHFIVELKRNNFKNEARSKSLLKGASDEQSTRRTFSLNDAQACLRMHGGVVEVIKRM